MSELPLPGLRATEPIGFLAAIGLLRVCTQRKSLGLVKLGWSDDAGWPAVLHTDRECDRDGLIDDLLAHMRGRSAASAFNGRADPPRVNRSAPWLSPNHWDDIKVPCDDYRSLLATARVTTDERNREAADFLSALGSELIAVGGKDAVKPSALHMTSGNQAFLETARELGLSLDAAEPSHRKASCPPDEAFQEAVFDARSEGTRGWHAADEFSAIGYDPAREAVYALVATAPTTAGPRSTRAAVWLAVEALPLFPSLPVGRRLRTRGFDIRSTAFRWAVWEESLSLNAVRTIVGSRDANEMRPVVGRLRRLGIRAVMESARVTIGQGYGQFRPAVRVREQESENTQPSTEHS
jgi:hypothetical protein